jgi:16S rRNA (guanine966-N2)-methyltransferase
MRIIAGRYKRRQLASPPESSTTRPLPDRVRESLFNLLRGHFDDASVLDGFAGVGSFGLEAASRGASHVVMVERDKRVSEVLRQNVAMLGAEDIAQVVTGDALGPAALARCRVPINIAFLDPPYAMVRDIAGWGRVRGAMSRIAAQMASDGYLMVRTPWPFLQHVETEAPTPPKRRHGKREEVYESLTITEVESLDDFADDGEDAHVFVPDGSAEEPEWLEGDLSIEGAIGPETHPYGTTAIHLYMRREAGA